MSTATGGGVVSRTGAVEVGGGEGGGPDVGVGRALGPEADGEKFRRRRRDN